MITVPNCAKEEGVKGVGEIREGFVIWICFAMIGGFVGFFFLETVSWFLFLKLRSPVLLVRFYDEVVVVV